MRTGKGVTLPDTTQAATRTGLARVARIDCGYGHSMLLCFAGNRFTNSTMLPERKPTTQSATSDLALLRFGHMQVLKHEHGMWGCPLDKLFCGLLGKGAGTMALLATKPIDRHCLDPKLARVGRY